ncbi:HEXXH motif domain-containing protein [Streptomyces naganishii]|uniref:HEXXH motif domain-containing protein n=1 Tax=Streptomyces naganishii JCM 4654 TaxID=1306179 RepID=A0A918Y4T3_9ACTN|nr:HEXXH motif domain-containing protein [Streptomyces naganishii]GHD89693.1 HEXXH motif domain-containing protein [Streptomyces naganishii JCM 4654]
MSGTTSGLLTGDARHHIPVTDLDAVAAGRVTPRTARRLFGVERTRRMLMFRGVVAAATGTDPGPLPPPARAVELLLRAERAHPEAVQEIIDHPAVGVWAVHLLGRLRSPGPPDPAQPPLWQDTGYLHSLAAAAALRAGISASVPVPVRAGTVSLPTLGRAEFPGPHTDDDGTAVLETTARDTAVRDDTAVSGTAGARLTYGSRTLFLPRDPRRSGPGWHPVRTLVWHPGGQAHSVALDDADPYRDFRDLHPRRDAIGAGEEAQWRRLLARTGRLLTARHPEAAGLVSSTLKALVPLPRTPRFHPASASYTEAVGSTLASLPHDAIEFAATLVHEARHSVLNSLGHQVRLVGPAEPAGEPLFYVPWRADPRPVQGVLHGAYAFAGVADFWRVERHALRGGRAALAHFEFALWRDAVTEALRALAEPGARARLTSWGRRFVAELAARHAPLEAEAVPERPLALARGEALDLRVTWRLHHLLPEPEALHALADRWVKGETAARAADPAGALPDAGLRPLADVPAHEPRGELRRALLLDGSLDGFPARSTAGSTGGSPGGAADAPALGGRRPDLLAADLRLVAGDAAGALAAYRAILAGAPDARPAWAGLALALRTTRGDRAARPLLDRPELVRSLALVLRQRGEAAPDPLSLCAWLTGDRGPAT